LNASAKVGSAFAPTSTATATTTTAEIAVMNVDTWDDIEVMRLPRRRGCSDCTACLARARGIVIVVYLPRPCQRKKYAGRAGRTGDKYGGNCVKIRGQTVCPPLPVCLIFFSNFRHPPSSTVVGPKEKGYPSILPKNRNVATMEAAFMDSGTTVDKVSFGQGAPSQRTVALPMHRAAIVAVIAFHLVHSR
jgi:hypothetical protein